MNGTLPFSATLNGKWKFVGHVEQFRGSLLLLSVHNFICANCQSTPLSLPLSFPALQAHMLACFWNGSLKGLSRVSRQQLWFMPRWKPSLYGLYRTMNVSSKLCQLPSITGKNNLTIGPSSTTGSHSPAHNLFQPAQNNVKHNFMWSADYEDEEQLERHSFRCEFESKSKYRNVLISTIPINKIPNAVEHLETVNTTVY